MNYLVGTFHKTGSVWMMQIIYEFTELTGKKFVTVAQREINNDDISDESDSVLFDYQSLFLDPLNLTTNSKGFIVVRHPKDQIISATRYHCTSSEYWLHEPKSEYGGKTYQQKINELKTWEEKIKFEMHNASKYNTNSMANFSDSRFIKIKYEDLISGYPLPECIDSISKHLNFTSYEEDAFINAYVKTHMNNNQNSHILDGSINQWRRLWDESLNDLYNKIYPGVEEKLGYV